jgi:hypothetical protein
MLARSSLGLEEQDGAVAQVEVDEVLGLVGDEGAEIASHDAVPGRAFPLVELYGILLGNAASSAGEG